MKRVLLVTNPLSGKSNGDTVDRISRVLGALGDVEVAAPSSIDVFDHEVRSAAAAVDLVVVAGGDGTLNRAINALEDGIEDFLWGLVPTGTGNDLARTLRLPTDPVEAARVVVEGAEHSIDVGRASGGGIERLFVNACLGGFPVEVDEAIEGGLKKRLGPMAFWVGGARAAVDLERATVTMDGIEVTDCVAVGVGNGKSSGGGLCVWPDAAPDDGLLDGCALPAPNHAAALRLVAKVKSCTHNELDEVKTCRARRIEVSANPPIEFNVDGELVGLRSPATFELVARVAIKVPA